MAGGEKKRFALIGRRLGHSWSQLWFTDLFGRLGLEGYSYELHEMASLDGLRRWVGHDGICGFNVTIPYKQAIIPYLDGLSGEAGAIGAVNCVCVNDGRLIGHNTDAPAFGWTLASMLPPSVTAHAVVLGTGGAARAVGYALGRLGIEHLFVSRNPQLFSGTDGSQPAPGSRVIGYGDLAALRLPETAFNILVNATPVGMWPDVDACPWTMPLTPFDMVYDLIYNPSPTLLLRRAAGVGAVCRDGLAMLQRQAALSWSLWNGGAE